LEARAHRAPWIYDPGDVIDFGYAMRLLESHIEQRAEPAWSEFAGLEGPLPNEAVEVLRIIRRGPRL